MQIETPSGPPRLLILGSCVSRDILNFTRPGQVVLDDYFARSSLAALTMAPVTLCPSQMQRIASSFQRRTVERETTKDFYRRAIACTEADAILIDMIDERFDIYEAAPGALVTVSSELQESGYLTGKPRNGEEWVRSGSGRHRALWRQGLERLFAALAAHGLAQRVIVNKVFWAEQLEDGTPLPEEGRQKRQLANEHLAWMYEEMARHVPASRWLVPDPLHLRASPTHRWGIAPFHYTDAYYRQMAKQLVQVMEDIPREDGIRIVRKNGLFEIHATGPVSPRRLYAFGASRDGRLLHVQGYSAQASTHFDAGGDMRGVSVWVHILTRSHQPGALPEPVRTTHVLACSDEN